MNQDLSTRGFKRPGRRRTRQILGAVAALALGTAVVAGALDRFGNPEPPVIDLAASDEWTAISADGVDLLVHEVPGGWMVRTPGGDPELAMFYPDPDHAWRGGELSGEESELGGTPVRRQAVPRGWLIHHADRSGKVLEPFFVPDAEHDGIFEPKTELIFAVNGFDFDAVTGKES